ncbi:MAG: hypothetical protein QW354_05280 [Desulfurococcaceae archaeon]
MIDVFNREKIIELVNKLREMVREITELVFCGNKILFPAIHVPLPEGPGQLSVKWPVK